MSNVYKLFTDHFDTLAEFSDHSLIEMYNGETHGTPVSKYNGFFIGKKRLNITIKMWKEDLKLGNLSRYELYNDRFPHWWLDKVLGDK